MKDEASGAGYVVDTSVLIQAHRLHYPFDVHPGFWNWLHHLFTTEVIASIDRVRSEISDGDELFTWVKSVPSACFRSTADTDVQDAYKQLMDWAVNEGRFTDEAKATFAIRADAWLVAYAMVTGCAVVTEEKPAPNAKNEVKIPDAGAQFGVSCINTIDLKRAVGVAFQWNGD